MLPLLSTLAVSQRRNHMSFVGSNKFTRPFFIPEQRVDMIKEAFDRLREGKCTVSGSKDIK